MEIGGISSADILFFTKHLSMVLKSGLTLEEGLGMLEEEATKQNFKKMITTIREGILGGQPFHATLANYPKSFSLLYVHLVKTGELAGALQQNLEYLAEEMHKTQELKRKVTGAMTYPLIILIAVLGLGFFIALFILPKIVPLFKNLNVELPLTTRGLLFIADSFVKNGWTIAIATVLSLIVLFWLLKRPFMRPLLHPLFLKLPLIGKVMRNLQLTRFTRTLATLLKSGIPLSKSLEITAEATGNVAYKKAIHSFITVVEKGDLLSHAMQEYAALFPLLTSRMVAVAERTGSLETTLFYLSGVYEEEVDSTLKNFATTIEPMLLIFIGLVVGLVAISILGPIYKITGNIRQ